jgi:hypothetical protein
VLRRDNRLYRREEELVGSRPKAGVGRSQCHVVLHVYLRANAVVPIVDASDGKQACKVLPIKRLGLEAVVAANHADVGRSLCASYRGPYLVDMKLAVGSVV